MPTRAAFGRDVSRGWWCRSGGPACFRPIGRQRLKDFGKFCISLQAPVKRGIGDRKGVVAEHRVFAAQLLIEKTHKRNLAQAFPQEAGVFFGGELCPPWIGFPQGMENWIFYERNSF